jgi:hypothetical protein
MMHHARRLAAAGAVMPLPGAAWAECLGSGCYDGLAWLFGGAIVILGLVIAAIVLMVLRRWRAVAVIGGLIAVTAAVVALQI